MSSFTYPMPEPSIPVKTMSHRESENCRAGALPGRVATELVTLQIFLCPGADAIECFLDILDRVGNAETQIAFPEFAERSAGQSRDAGVIEERVGQSLRRPPGRGDVRKNIKRAVRQLTGEPFDLVQSRDHHVAAFLEVVAHVID